jgi:hypothetical protein
MKWPPSAQEARPAGHAVAKYEQGREQSPKNQKINLEKLAYFSRPKKWSPKHHVHHT